MNYPYPIPASQGNIASFVASSTGKLGIYTKALDANTYIVIDYSQLVPEVDVLTFYFRVKPGGEPQLLVSNVLLDAGHVTFNLSGGIGGRTYEVTVNSKLAFTNEIRSDVLTVNVPGDDCDSCQIIQAPVNNGVTSPDGSLLVNTAPRFFVSSTPPNGANVMDQWYNPTTGNLYSNASNGSTANWVILQGGPPGPNWWLGLPTTLPPLPNVLWNNGGVISVS